MEPVGAVRDTGPRIDEHFDHIRANLIRCEECNENFFFDFLRHPRYFVTHFKMCHLKNVLYRFNGCSEEENQRVRFGPRRKRDATTWFGQLKSTEKRMISMQDNKWGEIAERECWSCRLCKHTRKSSDMPHAFEPNELGRRQALLHLRQFHEVAYNAFLRMLPAVDSSSGRQHVPAPVFVPRAVQTPASTLSSAYRVPVAVRSTEQVVASAVSPPSAPTQSVEAERSRLRRMKATSGSGSKQTTTRTSYPSTTSSRYRKTSSEATKNRGTRQRRSEASPEAREREMKRSRDRRREATDQQRSREALRSRTRRQNATDEQRLRERERCRRRYEALKQQKLLMQQSGSASDVEMQPATPTSSVSITTMPLFSGSDQFAPPRPRVLPADLERRNQQLLQQQAGLGLQIRSLYASLSQPPTTVEHEL
ncbi:hypothetical protein P3T76_011947 [Phytophthora citrophthora]|uniref:Uncharacterized protein n=1 Tax=Phytophthora citrophthora TaxID=4793 RepID=A0AAD9G8F1_9STRA|nr:hypothetical protein P3T76_011947 [Phytophthora citrophthora]